MRAQDAEALYEICLRTGHHGADASSHHTDPRLLGEVYVGPYLAHSADLAFVLTDADDVPVGYVLGVADTRAFEAICDRDWWPPLRNRYPLAAFPPGTPDGDLVQLMHQPPRADPAVLEHHPAHLHVDLLPAAQGGGHGRRLIEHLLDELRAREVPGVHLGVSALNRHAVGFYRHLGFRTLSESPGGVLLGLRTG